MLQGSPMILAQGVAIWCPRCKRPIAETKAPLYRGMRIKASQFKWALGYERAEGQRAACGKCGSRVLRKLPDGVYAHLVNGWVRVTE